MMPRAKQNARRHGVLSAPPAAEVEAHLRKILELKTGAPLPDLTGTRTAAALTLARREAELDRARAHCVACVGARDDPEVEAMRELMRDIIEDCDVDYENRSEAARRLLRMDLFERWVIQGRKDLSARYLREAMGRRRRALEAYLAVA